MPLAPDKLYHLYNRGNNRQPIFFQKKNYDFFKQKAYKELSYQIDILAYCLMPNHFHFLISRPLKTRFKQNLIFKGSGKCFKKLSQKDKWI